jgi:diguanylate cyclase (GGDEF)-like protein
MLAMAVGVVALAVWAVSEAQRSVAERAFEESRVASRMETALLDQQTAARGFALTSDPAFLGSLQVAVREFVESAAEARDLATSPEQRRALASIVAAAARWRALPSSALVLSGGPFGPRAAAELSRRKRLFDEARSRLNRFQEQVDGQRRDRLARAELVSIATMIGLAVLFFAFGSYAIEREARRVRTRRARARRYRDTQEEFAQAMQIMRGEEEAHALVESHLERAIPSAEVTVLNRNNSANRLYAATSVADVVLAGRLLDAEPDGCLAVRLGQPHESGGGTDSLLACGLCGKTANDVVCTPSLVGGEVIGSVLVRSERTLDEHERELVAASVSQAAPVLANLRNLAVAEQRAATDALTGLPNSRSCRDNLKRMVAHASRTIEPLSAVMVDLDNFKQINDRFGHGAGDDVLAAVGEALSATLRASDFGGRYGGEELLLLLPGTDRDGAVALSEKLCAAIVGIELPHPGLRVTASLGVATYPLDALDGEALLRIADRALYSAKRNGRNRVETIASAERDQPPPDIEAPALDDAGSPPLGR